MSDSDLIKVVSCIISRVIRRYENSSVSATYSKFTSAYIPSISVFEYLERILKYFHCSVECFVLSLIYIDRLIKGARFVVNSFNVHRLLVTAVMVAAKYSDDSFFVNSYYADVGGVSLDEMNELEAAFLDMIDYNLHVNILEYQKYHNELYNHATSAGCRLCRCCNFPRLVEVQANTTQTCLVYLIDESGKSMPNSGSPHSVTVTEQQQIYFASDDQGIRSLVTYKETLTANVRANKPNLTTNQSNVNPCVGAAEVVQENSPQPTVSPCSSHASSCSSDEPDSPIRSDASVVSAQQSINSSNPHNIANPVPRVSTFSRPTSSRNTNTSNSNSWNASKYSCAPCTQAAAPQVVGNRIAHRPNTSHGSFASPPVPPPVTTSTPSNVVPTTSFANRVPIRNVRPTVVSPCDVNLAPVTSRMSTGSMPTYPARTNSFAVNNRPASTTHSQTIASAVSDYLHAFTSQRPNASKVPAFN